MSAEHLFRATYRTRIPHRPRTNRTQYGLGVAGEERVVEIPLGAFDQKVNGVCKQCNESWMNDIDAAVEGIVLGLATGTSDRVRRAAIAPLARWATKVALMRTRVDKSLGWEADADLFTVFHETRNPPPGTVVRIALCDPTQKESGSNSFIGALGYLEGSPLPIEQQEPLFRYGINAVSWTMGFFYIHVMLASPPMSELAHSLSSRVGTTLGPASIAIHPGAAYPARFRGQISLQAAARAGNLHHLRDGTPLRESDAFALPE